MRLEKVTLAAYCPEQSSGSASFWDARAGRQGPKDQDAASETNDPVPCMRQDTQEADVVTSKRESGTEGVPEELVIRQTRTK